MVTIFAVGYIEKTYIRVNIQADHVKFKGTKKEKQMGKG